MFIFFWLSKQPSCVHIGGNTSVMDINDTSHSLQNVKPSTGMLHVHAAILSVFICDPCIVITVILTTATTIIWERLLTISCFWDCFSDSPSSSLLKFYRWRSETRKQHSSSHQLFLSLVYVMHSARILPVESMISSHHHLLGLPLFLMPSKLACKMCVPVSYTHLTLPTKRIV